MYNKNCKICGCAFVGQGRASMYCDVCKQEVSKLNRQKARDRANAYKLRKGIVKRPGVGSGKGHDLGELHPAYRNGRYVFDRLRIEKKDKTRYCERCGEDLLEVHWAKWCVHHKDHDHWNHSEDNLELLCKRCHQIEHKCHLAFVKGATTRA